MDMYEISDITQHCMNFPNPKNPIVERENIVNTIDRLFETDSIIFIEGEENVGKTIIASLFAKKHCSETFCMFLRCTNSLGANIASIRSDIYVQINYYLNKIIPLRDEIIPLDDYINIVYGLTRHCSRTNKTVYFIIDGIDNIDNATVKEAVLELFPIGNCEYFKFVIVTNDCDLKKSYKLQNSLYSLGIRDLIISDFTEGEAIQIFSDLDILNKDDILKLFRTFKKPGHLASIYRLIVNSEDPKKLIDDPISGLSELFESEWINNKIDKEGELFLAILAFDTGFHTCEYVAALCDSSVERVVEFARKTSFIDYDCSTKIINFISDGFLKFVLEKLQYYKNDVMERSIKLVMQNPDDLQSIQQAPYYFEQLGQYDKLSEYLTTDRLLTVFRDTNSESSTIALIKNGFDAALKIGHEQNAFSLSLAQSVTNAFISTAVSEQEIKARCILNDFETAMHIARQARTKEDKILLLSQLMMWYVRKGLTPDEVTIQEIKTLHASINYSNIKGKAIKIATYMLHALPDIAVEIIEILGEAEKGDNSTDIAIAKITMSGIIEQNENNNLLEIDNSTISNTIVRNIYTELKSLLKNQPIEQVTKEIDAMTSKSSKLLFLRNWLILHKKEDVDGKITNQAMEMAIDTSVFLLTTSLLLDLSSALPYIKEEKIRADNITWFDKQIAGLSSKSPCIDYVELQTIIAEAQIEFNKQTALLRIQDVILWTEEIEDLSIQAECLAVIMGHMNKLDCLYTFYKDEGFTEECKYQIDKLIDKLVTCTADHLDVFTNLVRIISKFDFKNAMLIIEKVNTAERRDALRRVMINSIIDSNTENKSIEFIYSIFAQFEDSMHLSSIYSSIVRKFRKSKELCQANPNLLEKLLKYDAKIQILDSRHLCVYCASILLIRSHLSILDAENSESIFTDLFESWNSIDSSEDKIKIGYDTIYILAENFPEYANKMLTVLDEYKKITLPLSGDELDSFVVLIKLLIHGLAGLADQNMILDSDYEKLEFYIRQVPSDYIQCILWSDYALILFRSNQVELANKVFSSKILKTLDKYSKNNISIKHSLIINIAPTYFLSCQAIFLDNIVLCSQKVSNSALYEVCRYYITKTIPSDPYERSNKSVYSIEYSDIPIIFSLIGHMNDECLVYDIIKTISQYVYQNSKIFTRQQRIDISVRIDSIIAKVFVGYYPLNHIGYKLCASIQSEMLNDGIKNKTYKNIKENIPSIKNIADQSYVWCELASASKKQTERRSCFDKSIELIEEIPSIYDRVWHLEMVARLAWHANEKALSKDCLGKAVREIVTSNSKDKRTDVSKRIINLAHRLDPEFARTLATVIENEATSNLFKQTVKKQELQISALDSVIDHKHIDNESENEIDYPNVIWEAWGMLNAGIINPTKLKLLFEYYKIAANADILKSYSIYSWIIENILLVYTGPQNKATVVRTLVDSLKSSCEYCISYLSHLYEINFSPFKKLERSIDGVIGIGERRKFMEELELWLKENTNSEIYIIDPYFCIEDLEILKYIYSANDNVSIVIVTSEKQQRKQEISLDAIESTYCEYWRDNISLIQLSKVKLILLNTEPSGNTPIHDRWIISGDVGLHLGTSINSIGNKLSGANAESTRVIDDVKSEIHAFINGERTNYNGEKIRCRTYQL
jgi:hypothetical protein